MLEFVFWLSIGGIIYAYFGYPCVLWCFSRVVKQPSPQREGPVFPRMTVIITACNEEKTIREKITNTLTLRYGSFRPGDEELQILVASDGSTDATNNLVSKFHAEGIELVALEERKGKEAAQAQAVQQARGEILVFTDVRAQLAVDALQNIALHFQNQRVGAVSSVDRLEDTGTTSSGENFYIFYEMWLRRLESSCGSLVGLSGSCFAVRKILCQPFRTDVPSDFYLLLRARQEHLIGIHADDVVCRYPSLATEEQEFKRKIRTVLRGITTLFACREVLNPAVYGMFALQVISHKLFRWLVPWFVLFGAVSLFGLFGKSLFYTLMLFIGLALGCMAIMAFCLPALRQIFWFKVPLYFFMVNFAIVIAWGKFLIGQRTVFWDPSIRS